MGEETELTFNYLKGKIGSFQFMGVSLIYEK